MNTIHLGRTAKRNFITYGIVAVSYLVVTLLAGAGLLTNSLQGQLVPICTYVIMAISLNLTVGILGELSLGHAGFMSLGAFAGALFSVCTQ
ncbi:MAG: branched-chain amino acid ABC transporter permease, partial [Ruthenibacterium sp.]